MKYASSECLFSVCALFWRRLRDLDYQALHSGPELGQFVRKFFFAQKYIVVLFDCHIFAFFSFFLSFFSQKVLYLIPPEIAAAKFYLRATI